MRGSGPCGRAEAFLKISLKESGTEKGAAGDEAEAGSADTQAAGFHAAATFRTKTLRSEAAHSRRVRPDLCLFFGANHGRDKGGLTLGELARTIGSVK